MQIQFQGAARTVTGSMHVLTVNGKTILLDCGTYHGRREESRKRNEIFPFDPSSIDAVVLSHAHIDHSGNLPTLVKQGFHGAIYATLATKDLCNVMLRDSAHIQEKDAEFVNKKHLKKRLPPVAPLYTIDDAEDTITLFQGIKYGEEFPVVDGIDARFEDAGHILGSASVSLTLRENGKKVMLAFTGDLGRPRLPILRDPVFIGDADYLISESTYGGRFHAPIAAMEEQLLDPLRRGIDRGAKMIIPAFSVGRTQEIVYVLHNLSEQGKIDNLPVFVDSPLSINVTNVFKTHPECFDEETHRILKQPRNNDPFGFARLTYIRDVNMSKELNDRKGPYIIISAQGMCEAGRILHHLSNSITDPKNMVIIVGYQAEHTLGKRLVMKEPVVNIFGEPHELKAEVVVLNSFSGHADRNELLEYTHRFDRRRLRQTFLVHGDFDQSEKLAAGMTEAGMSRVSIPERGDVVELA
ncbi:MAG: MBL fold metallo-hydrolase [Ignavibacteriae bacterium]|nr:MBL fold metallo-hydrolase [Ignavibacteriota bacterium]